MIEPKSMTDTLADRIGEIKERAEKFMAANYTQDDEDRWIYYDKAGESCDEAELMAAFALSELSSAEKWRMEVIEVLVVNHIYTAEHETDPKKALKDLIIWEVKVALDPQVSKEAAALEQTAREKEREQCCKDVCMMCSNPDEWKPAEFLSTALYPPSWRHQRKNGGYALNCAAGPIRSRG